MSTPQFTIQSDERHGSGAGALLGFVLALVTWMAGLGVSGLVSPNRSMIFFLVCPALTPALAGWVATWRKRRKLAVGFFVAAGIVALLESACAVAIFNLGH